MPSNGANNQQDDVSAERDKDKAGKGKASSKSKDLSHVPCKFFKVGGCTAGSACPFSHHVVEPGESKSVCTWFVKGSCKFGHKCALAHVLPGQPMSMDKRNKRAAQTAAGGKSGEKGGQGRDRGRRGGHEGDHAGRSRERKSGNVQGASPPIGMGIGSRAPITISKAAPTPAALSDALSGPALKDTDFPYNLPDDLDELTATPRQPPPRQFSPVASSAPPPPSTTNANAGVNNGTAPNTQAPPTSTLAPGDSQRRPSPLPLARSSGSYSSAARLGRNNAPVDFGPVGSPPQASPGFIPGHVTRSSVNGFSPGTSPPVRENPAPFGSSPFSAPGSKSLFLSYSLGQNEPATQAMPFNSKWGDKRTIRARDLDNAVEDEDLEEFLPSSLTDLLSPSERERRMSRTKHGARPSVDSQLFSRSVPSTNMLDIKSIWDEQNKPRGREADASANLNNPQMRGISQGRFGEEESKAVSSSLMGTSNVSAGFLAHAHRPTGLTGGGRAVSAQSFEQSTMNNHGEGLAPDFAISASIDPVSTLGAMHSRPIPGAQKAELSSALSPSTRALRNHAPGQSLPQGLAAGLSRLHLVPAASPSNGQYDWSPDGPRLGTTPRAYDPFALDDNTPPRPTFSTLNKTGPSPALSGLAMTRTPSSSSQTPMSPPATGQANQMRRWQGTTWASPLAQPVKTNDEEDGLFHMD